MVNDVNDENKILIVYYCSIITLLYIADILNQISKKKKEIKDQLKANIYIFIENFVAQGYKEHNTETKIYSSVVFRSLSVICGITCSFRYSKHFLQLRIFYLQLDLLSVYLSIYLPSV